MSKKKPVIHYWPAFNGRNNERKKYSTLCKLELNISLTFTGFKFTNYWPHVTCKKCNKHRPQSKPTSVEKVMDKWLNEEEYIARELERAGFDGLYSDECGCEISDLFPCNANVDEAHACQAGYKVMCDENCDHGDTVDKGDWHIQKDKPK
jgi:hypothetical protein